MIGQLSVPYWFFGITPNGLICMFLNEQGLTSMGLQFDLVPILPSTDTVPPVMGYLVKTTNFFWLHIPVAPVAPSSKTSYPLSMLCQILCLGAFTGVYY